MFDILTNLTVFSLEEQNEIISILAGYTHFFIAAAGVASFIIAFISRHNKKAIEKHRIEMLGSDLDGKGGHIGDIKEEIKITHDELLHKIDDIKSTQEIIKSYIESDIKEIKDELRYIRRSKNGSSRNSAV